jgi:hypothetical protein
MAMEKCNQRCLKLSCVASQTLSRHAVAQGPIVKFFTRDLSRDLNFKTNRIWAEALQAEWLKRSLPFRSLVLVLREKKGSLSSSFKLNYTGVFSVSIEQITWHRAPKQVSLSHSCRGKYITTT